MAFNDREAGDGAKWGGNRQQESEQEVGNSYLVL